VEYSFQLEQGKMVCTERGNRVEIVIRVRNEGRGLYKGWIRGDHGSLELGTLMPEHQELRLRRSISLEQLKLSGCWPIREGGTTLVHSFGNGMLPPGWQREENPRRLFPKDRILQEAAGRLKNCLVSFGQEGFSLAVPYGSARPFELIPVFCFARIRTFGGRQYAIFPFDEEGNPRRQE